MPYYVYELQDDDQVPFYVGKGKGNRCKVHRRLAERGSQQHVHRKIRKMWSQGRDFTPVIVEYFDDEKDAFDYEMELIAAYRREGIPLTNMTNGGEGSSGHRRSEETRQKLSEARQRRVTKPETVEKIRRSLTGKPRSEEAKAKLRKPKSPEARKNMGRKTFSHTSLSDEHKDKISRALSGKPRGPLSDEHRAALRAAWERRRRRS